MDFSIYLQNPVRKAHTWIRGITIRWVKAAMNIKSERKIVLRRMHEIETEAWVAMMNHPTLAKHLPLHLKTRRNLS